MSSTNYSSRSSRNHRSGGQRRRGGRGRNQQHPRSHNSSSQHERKSSKQSWFQRLLGWFIPTGKTSPATKDPEESRSSKPRGPRELPPIEVITPKLYVGNLSYDIVESDLFDLFTEQGQVKHVEVVFDRRSGKSKGFGFVEMEHLESAKTAAEKLNGAEFQGRQIIVNGAKTK